MAARILVIEDDPASLHLMVYLLSAFGHIPLIAQNGDDGLEVTYRERPDLILCDIHLPKIDGFGIARTIKNHSDLWSIPLVAVTAYAMVGDRDRTMAAGFDGYITKPITPEAFIRDVEAFLKLRV